MSIKIKTTPNHLLIKSMEGLAYWDIFQGFTALMRESNKDKNAIWHIQKGPTNFSVGDFGTILKLILDKCPNESAKKKIAFVIEAEIHFATIESFIEFANDSFRQNLKAFRQFRFARQWLVKK